MSKTVIDQIRGMTNGRSAGLLALVAGLVLFCSACAKSAYYVSLLNAFGIEQVFGSVALCASMALLILTEFALAFLLFSGIQQRFVMLLTGALFGCFAIYSGVKLVTGETDCGCFGYISGKLPYMAVLDTVLSFSLIAVALTHGKKEVAIAQGIRIALGRATALAIVWFAILLIFEVPIVARFAGRPPLVCGWANAGTPDGSGSELLVYNRWNLPISLVGTPATCDLKLFRNFPQVVHPGGLVVIPMTRSQTSELISLGIFTDAPGWFGASVVAAKLAEGV